MQPSETCPSLWPSVAPAPLETPVVAHPAQDVPKAEQARLLVLRDGQTALTLPLRAVALVALSLALLVPATAGAALRLSLGAPVEPWALVMSERLSELRSTHPLAHFGVMPASKPPAVAPPPPVPEVTLPTEPRTPEWRRGHLRVFGLHLKDHLDVVPFDAEGRPIPEAFAQIAHVWRCRVTGHEVRVHPRLVRLLVAINDFYDRPLQLISGHRVPHTIGTSPTSQHTLGNAADVRVSGVPTEELRALAKKLGGRGVGLYPEQRFVHVDFRPGRKYFWTEQDDAEGEDGGRLAKRDSAAKDAPVL